MSDIRIRVRGTGWSLRDALKAYRAARLLRRLIRRHGYEAVAKMIEQAAPQHNVTVRRNPCRNCPHPMTEHDREGCTVTIPCEDPDFGPTQTCPCCERRLP